MSEYTITDPIDPNLYVNPDLLLPLYRLVRHLRDAVICSNGPLCEVVDKLLAECGKKNEWLKDKESK